MTEHSQTKGRPFAILCVLALNTDPDGKLETTVTEVAAACHERNETYVRRMLMVLVELGELELRGLGDGEFRCRVLLPSASPENLADWMEGD